MFFFLFAVVCRNSEQVVLGYPFGLQYGSEWESDNLLADNCTLSSKDDQNTNLFNGMRNYVRDCFTEEKTNIHL